MDSSVKHIDIEDGVNGYVDLVNHVLKHGEPAAPRGINTLEIENATIHFHNAVDALPLSVNRGTVPGIGAVEACQLLSGTSFPKLVIDIGPQFANYTEDDGMFHGSYGTRTKGQYDVMVDRLKKDPDTRQAVVTIWNPERDMLEKKRDYPCTILHQFRVRRNRLNMSVYMRSNDVWLGAAYDFFQFTRVQIAIASILGIEPGSYSHHVGSLHIYEENYDAAAALRKTNNIAEVPSITGRTWREVESSALIALQATSDGKLLNRLSPNERWYAEAMLKAIEKNRGNNVKR
jgi:thymidylate synthase